MARTYDNGGRVGLAFPRTIPTHTCPQTLSILNARLQLAIGNIDQSLSYLEFAIEAAPEKKIDSSVRRAY